MGRSPCCDKANVKRGPWSPQEDATLRSYIESNGTGGNWISLPQKAGLKRCGKSCRLRWLNYLRPDIKHGGFTAEEDNIIFSLYKTIGSRWSVIASHLHGRTDNDVKNYWNTKLMKKIMAAGETINSSIVTKQNKINLHQISPPPIMKSEKFLPPTTLESKFPYAFELNYQQQKLQTEFELAENNSVIFSSSIKMQENVSNISYLNWNNGVFPEHGFPSWTELLGGFMTGGNYQENSTVQGIYQSLYS